MAEFTSDHVDRITDKIIEAVYDDAQFASFGHPTRELHIRIRQILRDWTGV